MKRAVDVLGKLSILGFFWLFYIIFIYAPVEAEMGLVQKIFYIHVPLAWTAFLGFFLVCVFSILYLWKRNLKWDVVAASSAEIGVVFCTLVLITGSIWAKSAWGYWWIWDVRLTTTLILWLIYLGYLVLRSVAQSQSALKRFSAVYGILGFINVPVVYFSVRAYESTHPVVIDRGGMRLAPEMIHTLFYSLGCITVFFLFLALSRIRLGFLELEFLKIREKRRK